MSIVPHVSERTCLPNEKLLSLLDWDKLSLFYLLPPQGLVGSIY